MNYGKHIKKRANDDTSFISFVKDGGIGALACLSLSLILAIICSLIALLYKDPALLSLPIGIGILYVSSFFGGMVASIRRKSDKQSSYIASAVSGFIVLILYGIISTLLSLTALENMHSLNLILSVTLRFLCIPFSLLGTHTTISLNKAKKRKRRR